MPNDTIEGSVNTTAVATLGSPITSFIDHYGDQDWYQIDLVAGVGYQFFIQGTGDTPSSTTFFLYTASGQTIVGGTSDATGGPYIDGFTPATSGTYYIGVGSSSTLSSIIGQYTLLAAPMVDTVGEGTGTTATLEVGDVAYSSIDYMIDEDWYAIELVAGQVYEFEIGPGRDYIGQLFDPNLVLYDANGDIYATFDDGSTPFTSFAVQIDTTGTYYLAASLFPPGFSANVGTYTLQATNDPGDNVNTLRTLGDGEQVIGLINYEFDSDWYGVNLVAGVTYEFRTAEISSAGLTLALHDSTGASVGINTSDFQPLVQFTPSTSGTYFFEIRGVDPENDFGGYAITYAPIATTDTIGASIATSQALALGGTVNSVLESRSDHDWIAVNLVAGQSYAVQVVGTSAGNQLGPEVQFRDASGTLLTPAQSVSLFNALTIQNGAAVQFVATQTGTYYIDLSTNVLFNEFQIANAGNPGSYSLTMFEDINANVNTTATLAMGGSQTSTLDFFGTGSDRDYDWFRVDMVAGQYYYISMAPGDADSQLQTPDINVFNAAGDVVADNFFEFPGVTNYMLFQATTTGTYYVAAGSYGSLQWGNSYTISIEQLDRSADTIANNATTTTSLSLGATINSTIDYVSDVDWFSFNVVSGQWYTITLSGAGVNALDDLSLAVVYNGGSNFAGIEYADDGSLTWSFLAESNDTLHAVVTPGSVFGSGARPTSLSETTGGYSITLAAGAPPPGDYAGNATTAAVATLGTPFHSAVDYSGDVDWVRVTLEAGEYYNFSLLANGVTGEDGPFHVWLVNSNGVPISGDALRYPIQAPASGDYFVRVGRAGVYTSEYTLTVTEASIAAAITSVTPVTPMADGIFRLYFAEAGEVYTGNVTATAVGFTPEQIQTVLDAWGTIASYANVQFELTTDPNAADYIYAYIPGGGNDGFNANPYYRDPDRVFFFGTDGEVFGDFLQANSSDPGGPGGAMLLGYIGRQIGLTGGITPIREGSAFGDFWLAQGVYTMMSGQMFGWPTGESYEPGVPRDPYSGTYWEGFQLHNQGMQATPMAADIAALQAIYGAVAANTGDTTYDLSSLNGQFRAIWDTGGVDTVTLASGNASGSVIDLRPATLRYEWDGGGYISYVYGAPGGFTVAQGAVIENAVGAAGVDFITGNTGDNELTGNDGDDVLDEGGGGADTLDGGAGADVASWRYATQGVTVDLDSGAVAGGAAGDTLTSIEGAIGSRFSDVLSGDENQNALSGEDGADTLEGRDGDDLLSGGAGADTLNGGAGNDTASYVNSGEGVQINLLTGAATGGDAAGDALTGVERLTGSIFDDTLTGDGADNQLNGGMGDDVLEGGVGSDTLAGDSGFDTASYVSASAGVQVDLQAFLTGGAATGDTLSSIEAVMGSAHADILRGDATRNVLSGGAGADTLDGRAGNDTLEGGAGGDSIAGGGGNDTLTYAGSSAAVSVNLATGTGSGGDAQGDTFTSIENLIGSAFNDTLTGDAAANTLRGGDGADTLVGGGGADVLIGGLGDDTYHYNGVETLIAGGGADTVVSSVDILTNITTVNYDFTWVSNVTLVGSAIEARGNFRNNILIGNALANTLEGDAGNDVLDGGAGADTMHGGTGDDVFYVDNAGDRAGELVGQGADTVVSSISYVLGANFFPDFDNVENLTLTGASAIDGGGNALDNVIIGNSAANALNGFGGNDTLDGGAGADTMAGGFGNDLYYVDNVSDVVTEAGGQGTDVVRATASFTLAANVEQLVLLGIANINGTGNAQANTLTGNSGNNVLDGGAGSDAMSGGGGDDTYVVDNVGDVVTEISELGGVDTILSALTRTLGAHVENLTLTGAAATIGYGNALNNTITGNAAANSLYGYDGSDILDGGAGADQMFGGNGDDAYYVDNAGDVTSEVSALGGTDIVFSSISRNITANIENLTLTGSGDNTGSGNALNNVVVGNTGVNTLYGYDGNDRLDGGAGADTLFGANGDDTYVVDNAGDITVEGSALGGIDTVETYISRNLNANFENMTLLGSAAIAYGNVINNVLTGNALANSLYGFDGNDTLDGAGGADQMFGANGDDTYIVDNAADVTSETSALGGIDTVMSSVARNLNANIENLTLTGSANVTGAGNVLNNIIIGNAGANTLYGLDGNDRLDGGLGADTLQGGVGADEYVFSTALGGGNVDAIAGFNVADDTIVLNSAVFAGLGAGTLAAGAFVIGTAAADADDRIIYNSATGQLFFDADGNGVGAAMLFATLSPGLALTSADFIIGGP